MHGIALACQPLRFALDFAHFHLQLCLPVAFVLDLAHTAGGCGAKSGCSNRTAGDGRRWQATEAVLGERSFGCHELENVFCLINILHL